MFIFKIMWDITLPILKFFYWLVMIIPKLVWEYIMVPYWWSEYESLGRQCYWDNLIPNYIYYGFSKPIIEWLLEVRWAIWVGLVWPIIYYLYIWLPLTILYYFRLLF